MKKFVITFLFTAFPVLAMAADGTGALSFAPPSTDYSVVFLGNLFGGVDGVLHGSGGIMGAMFGVFNSAVLALGGIIIMYTLLVSTMNTAHEGQILGQKWSSIWVPVRSTVGLALLVPKASGYCLMQIFVMWIVVQGVGAADKIWNAALDYMNRGGVIIRAQNKTTFGAGGEGSAIGVGASKILTGQVCMFGLQKALEKKRQEYLQQKQDGDGGPCGGNVTGDMKTICETAVPDFISSVNVIAVQNANPNATSYTAKMPNFDQTSPYNVLNGICGTINWNGFSQQQIQSMQNIAGSNQLETIKLSRAIGIQQIYTNLSSVARVMVNNDPQLSKKATDDSTDNYTPYAEDQFGVPYSKTGNICQEKSDICVTWGPASGSTGAVLFNGSEFQGAVEDYNSILRPALNLMNQAKKSANAKAARQFITDAENKGWILAGSYFFDLVKLNGSADQPQLVDPNSGLGASSNTLSNLTASFQGDNQTCVDGASFPQLCTWMSGQGTKINSLITLINGKKGKGGKTVPLKTESNQVYQRDFTTTLGKDATTVYGFINNSMAMSKIGQPGLTPDFQFANLVNIKVDTSKDRLPDTGFPCGEVKIVFFKFCLGRLLGNIFYNAIFKPVFNFFMDLFEGLIKSVIYGLLTVPLEGMSYIFRDGMKILTVPGINPIVALANMGTAYINFSGNLWIMLMTMVITPLGFLFLPLIALAMPLLLAWIGIMVTIGFITAYYVPLLPYLIFTFGAIAWLMAVIEAMVAGPIVALGVTHPEGHEAFGKGEQAIMILMNVFLRPSMMIIGYIAGIALSYVGVWLLNAGFEHAVSFMQPATQAGSEPLVSGYSAENPFEDKSSFSAPSASTTSGNYTDWAGIYAFFFSILAYTTTYLIIVQKSFTLITILPDRILRWIGSAAETIGGEAAQWGEEGKQKVEAAGGETQKAQQQIDKALEGYGEKGMAKVSGKASQKTEGSVSATPSEPPVE